MNNVNFNNVEKADILEKGVDKQVKVMDAWRTCFNIMVCSDLKKSDTLGLILIRIPVDAAEKGANQEI